MSNYFTVDTVTATVHLPILCFYVSKSLKERKCVKTASDGWQVYLYDLILVMNKINTSRANIIQVKFKCVR